MRNGPSKTESCNSSLQAICSRFFVTRLSQMGWLIIMVFLFLFQQRERNIIRCLIVTPFFLYVKITFLFVKWVNKAFWSICLLYVVIEIGLWGFMYICFPLEIFHLHRSGCSLYILRTNEVWELLNNIRPIMFSFFQKILFRYGINVF